MTANGKIVRTYRSFCLVCVGIGISKFGAVRPRILPQALDEHCNLSPEDLGCLQDDAEQHHWNDARTHRTMQVAVKHAVLTALKDSPFHAELQAFAKGIHALDLYQGARVLAHLMEKMHDFLLNRRHEIFSAGAQIGQVLRKATEIEATEVHQHVIKLGNCIDLLTLARFEHAERDLLQQCETGSTSRHHKYWARSACR